MERLRPGDHEQIGPWQIVNRLGSGGMGLVFLGTNGTRAAAIKIVRDHLLEDPTSRTRLAREVESLKKVESAYIAEIVGSDVVGSPAWIATSFVDGPSLNTLIENEGPLSEAAWVEFAKGLIHALCAVHKAGIIHRDVKPSNILLSATGPKLIDFGISFSNEATSITRTGLVAGTPAWLAPEQFENREITNAIDNFALGSVLFYAATGVAPWGGEDSSVAQVMRKILSDEPDVKKLSPLQRKLIPKLLEKDPKKRITAEQARELIGAIAEVPVVESVSLAKPTPSKSTKSRKPIAIVAAVATALIVVAGIFLFLPKSDHKSSSANTSGKSSSVKATPIPTTSNATISWSGEFAGDPSAQNGFGTTYKLYVCDQSISANSLKVVAPKNSGVAIPVPSLVKSDAVCGTGFDTIYVNGVVPKSGTLKYVLNVKTLSGQPVSYSYTITRN